MTRSDPASGEIEELRRWARRRMCMIAVVAIVLPLVALTGPSVAARLIDTTDLKNGAVTTKKIKKNAVSTAKIKKNAVTSQKIRDRAVGSAKLADGSVGSAKLADGAVGSAQLAPAVRGFVSAWSSVGPETDVTYDLSKQKRIILTAPELTQEVIDRSYVGAQMRFGNSIYTLPYTSYAGGKVSTVQFLPRPGSVEILRFTHDNSGSLGFGGVQFRYFITPVAADPVAGTTRTVPPEPRAGSSSADSFSR